MCEIPPPLGRLKSSPGAKPQFNLLVGLNYAAEIKILKSTKCCTANTFLSGDDEALIDADVGRGLGGRNDSLCCARNMGAS